MVSQVNLLGMNKTELYNFLKSSGFVLLEQRTSESFNDSLESFENDVFGLQLISSKSDESVDIYSLSDKSETFDLAIVKALLFNETILDIPTSMNEHYQFLRNNLHQINDLFSNKSYPKTKRKLEDLGNERAKQMFPGMIK